MSCCRILNYIFCDVTGRILNTSVQSGRYVVRFVHPRRMIFHILQAPYSHPHNFLKTIGSGRRGFVHRLCYRYASTTDLHTWLLVNAYEEYRLAGNTHAQRKLSREDLIPGWHIEAVFYNMNPGMDDRHSITQPFYSTF